METTFAIFKRNSLNAALVLAVLFMNGQIWLMNGRIEGMDDEIQSFRTDMAEEFKNRKGRRIRFGRADGAG